MEAPGYSGNNVAFGTNTHADICVGEGQIGGYKPNIIKEKKTEKTI